MRVDVEKYLLIGPKSERNLFFEKVQKLGIVQFIAPPKLISEKPVEIQTLVEALHILRRMVPGKESVRGFDFDSAPVFAQEVVERNEELERGKERKRILEKEIARIEPFGNFTLEDIRDIEEKSHRKIQFFFAKRGGFINPEAEGLFYISSAYGLDYYISINREKVTLPGLVEMHIDHSLYDLQSELATVKRKIDELESRLSALSHHKKLLQQGLALVLNQYHLSEAKSSVDLLLDGEIFAILGWVPKNRVGALEKLASSLSVFVEKVKVEQSDQIPTYLENEGLGKVGEDLLGIYDTPSHNDRDPSLWVFFSFALFFSIIVSDAGYGILLLCISLFLFYKYGKKKGLMRRLILLGISLSIGCIAWGVATFSFFGIEVPPDNPVHKYSLTNWVATEKADFVLREKGEVYKEWVTKFPSIAEAKTGREFLLGAYKEEAGYKNFTMYNEFSNSFFLELAIFLGSVHIILSFLRYIDKSWSGLGWILFIIGGYLFFPSILKATSLIHYLIGIPKVMGAIIGKNLLFGGIALAAVLAVIQKRLQGLSEVMHSIGIFADVMSYLRLYALSLAGMIMASTFDKMGANAPIYVGPFIIFFGHVINFTLALMGGVIHGLRLNFIEWYHYSFEGGGKRFNPLSLIKLE